MSLSSYDRYPLLFGPSPVHRLERLTAHLGSAALWAKREDCNSGIAYGGNKVRKLEYLAADAVAQGCDALVPIGGVQSNPTREAARRTPSPPAPPTTRSGASASPGGRTRSPSRNGSRASSSTRSWSAR